MHVHVHTLIFVTLQLIKATRERDVLASRLPLVYTQALSLLTSLIRCTTAHMIPYATLVNKCLLQVLDVTAAAKNGGDKKSVKRNGFVHIIYIGNVFHHRRFQYVRIHVYQADDVTN